MANPQETGRSLAEKVFIPEQPGLVVREIPFLHPLLTSIYPEKINARTFDDMVNISRQPDPKTGENPEVGFVMTQNNRLSIGDGTGLLYNFLGHGSFGKSEITALLTDYAKIQQQLIGTEPWKDITRTGVFRTLEGKQSDFRSLSFLNWCQGDIANHLKEAYRNYSPRSLQFRKIGVQLAEPVDGSYLIKYRPFFTYDALTSADQEFVIYRRPDTQNIAEIRSKIPDNLWTNALHAPDPENPEHWFLLLGKITQPFIRGIISIGQHHASLQQYLNEQNEGLKKLREHMEETP